MKRKLLYIFLSFVVLGLIIVFPSFADNDINVNSYNRASSRYTNTSSNTTNIPNSSYTPTAVISNTNDQLGFTNILNIMLLVIGILLVLFAIAILIRLNG